MANKRYVSPMGGSYEVGPEGRVTNRDKRLVVMLSLEEFVEVTAAAHDSMTSASSWTRNLILAALDQLDSQRETLKVMKRRYHINDDDGLEPSITVNRQGRGPRAANDPASATVAGPASTPAGTVRGTGTRTGTVPPDVFDADAPTMPGDPLSNLLADFSDDDGDE